MADETLEIQKVSAETKSAVSRKSAQTLPNRPSEQGYSAEEIKRRFYQPILDAANSALAEIDRVVVEANNIIGNVNGKLDDFIGNSELTAPYKKDLDDTVWVFNEVAKKYEFVITKAMHGVEDYKEIYVDLFLFGEGGKLVNCNNYDIYTNGDVRLYNENTGGGFVAIARNRDGFVKVYAVTEVDNVIGIAKVAKTNNYADLDNRPNMAQMTYNEEMIGKIISGQQRVNSALNAVSAVNAQYAASANNAENAVNTQTATRALQDGNGANIVNSYVKQSGNYPNVSVGGAVLADKAKADEDNLNIKANYAKQSGSYDEMTVGKAKSADTATSAGSATKATQDSVGAVITDKYVTKAEALSVETIAKALYPVGSILFSAVNTNPKTYISNTDWVAWGSGRVPVGVDNAQAEFNSTEKTGGDKTPGLPAHTHSYSGSTGSSTANHSHAIWTNDGYATNSDGFMRDDSVYGFSGMTGTNSSKKAFITKDSDSHVLVNNSDALFQERGSGSYVYSNGSSTTQPTAHTHSYSGSTGENTAVKATNGNLQPYITCYMWKRTA